MKKIKSLEANVKMSEFHEHGGNSEHFRNLRVSDTCGKAYVSEDGFDLCVICGNKTEYKTETPVDARIGYVGDGGGQTCRSCYSRL